MIKNTCKVFSNRLILLVLIIVAVFLSPLQARDGGGDDIQMQRYVVELQDPPLALYAGEELSVRGLRLQPTTPRVTGEPRLDVKSLSSVAYLEYLDERRRSFRSEAASLLGRDIAVTHEYRYASNGLAVEITAAEAELLADSPLVKSIARDEKLQLQTYAGPQWIGADAIWTGDAGIQARGENIVVGILDTGINWEHPSFQQVASDGYQHSNPLGSQLGLCSLEEVPCNSKLIGVYDFVEDDPSTEDVVEENTNGKDNNGHGSHVASIAAGNPVNVLVNGVINTQVSGVAPRANVISYRVCYQGEPQTADSAGCGGSFALAAVDQAIEDGVDVINYSVGGDARNPWQGGSVDRSFLSARAAGIFVATSAGNSGPGEATVGSPANAPWITAVGNASHGTIPGNALQNMSGGTTAAPDDMIGASLTDGTGKLVIVHAKDYGNALCGEGPAESQPTCGGNTGASNPWDGEKPFNGEIVVCDRGTYGRVEKGKNVLLAGAGGYVLANTEEWGEAIVPDEHCLPGTHIGYENAEILRNWLSSGSGHGASLSGLVLAESDDLGDILRGSSSRGPALSPVEDTLKPNLIAPGTDILAASNNGAQFRELSGTSMSSPHVAGAAALLRSARPGWTPSQLASVLETTATSEIAKDFDGSPATTEEVGAGRPQLGLAVNAGLYLNVSNQEFLAANPAFGGQPRDLNLPGLVDASCTASCSFSRTLTDQGGGGSWAAQAVDFPQGAQVSVSPSSFSLSAAASRTLNITVNVAGTGVINQWVSGKIRLSSPGYPDQYLTVNVFSDGGELPEEWLINDDRNGGWTMFNLSGLVALSDVTFTAGKLTRRNRNAKVLPEDNTNSDPYDSDSGVITRWYELPRGALWLYAETMDSTSEDVDLFVGRDSDGDGRAEESEELCSSTSPDEFERCDLYELPPGDYWVIAQNWTAGPSGEDEIALFSAAVEPGEDSSLAVSGPGKTTFNESFPVRVSWDNLNALPGETWLGAVGLGSNREAPNNVGIIPVRFNRTAVSSAAETFPLMNGESHGLALPANGRHDRVFIDVPQGTSSLTVTASGANATQSDALKLELVRLNFSQALTDPPFATPAGNAPVVKSATGSGGNGPSLTIDGGVTAGRWYAVLSNTSSNPVAVSVKADVVFSGTPVERHPGLWSPSSRPQLSQGYDYNWSGNNRAMIWYTYDEDGQPTWYLAAGASDGSNIWTADLMRVTNDGLEQQLAPVGKLSITNLNPSDAMFSFTLHGLSGTDRMMPSSALTCPDVGGTEKSYTGLWFRGVEGLGGASILMNASIQSQIHYLFDSTGRPRWLLAHDASSPGPAEPNMPMLQYTGYCAVCATGTVSTEEVGVVSRSFSTENAGSWTLDYLFEAPLGGSVERTDSIVKITDTMACE
jgi:subtilisin family serine protease